MTHKALYLRHSALGSCPDAVAETVDRATVRNKTLKKRKESLRKQNGQGRKSLLLYSPSYPGRLYRGKRPQNNSAKGAERRITMTVYEFAKKCMNDEEFNAGGIVSNERKYLDAVGFSYMVKGGAVQIIGDDTAEFYRAMEALRKLNNKYSKAK